MAGDQFCGDLHVSFWDLNLTWYSSKPDFTPCFKDTALFWIPTVIFWILVPFDLLQMYRSSGSPSRRSSIARIQIACLVFTTSIFLAMTIANLTLWRLGSITWFWWGFGSYSLYAITLIGITVVSWHQLRAGFTGSGAIWLSLFLSICCGSVHFASMIMKDAFDEQSKETIPRALFMTYYVATIITLIACSFSSVKVPPLFEETDQIPFAEEYCSFPNQMTFGWVFPMMWKGFKRDLDVKDLWALHPQEKSAYLASRFEKAVRAEFAAAVEAKKFTGLRLADHSDIPEVEIKSGTPSVMKLILKQFGCPALIAATLELIDVLLLFIEPIMVGYITAFATNIHSEPLWHGYFYAGVLACSLIVRSVLEQVAWFKTVRISRNVNLALMSCIYRKALKLTAEARKASTVGEIVNLMSVDVGRFYDFALDFNNMWAAPLQFILGFYITYRQVGAAAWAGVGYIIMVAVINGFVSRIYERFQEKQMELKDERVKLLTEVLNGMKVIKLYGWEPPFQQRIEEIRTRELKLMRYASYVGAFFEFSWQSTALMASLTVLATYVATSPDHSLNAEAVFVVISVFRILTFPLNLLPGTLAHIAMLRVSLKRVVNFFSGQELDEKQIDRDSASDVAVNIQNATFSWDSTTGSILHDISLNIPRGKLVAVVGKVGVGKSSLVSAICGEMHKVGGTVSVQGSIAFVPQQAWIQNMTIKDNILFGKALNERIYNNVIEACSLRQDLDMLPAQDETEIGERGINLSGGQKQRVSLARAVYQNADLYLLDDPLSAVDIHVGKHIFHHVIGSEGVLKDKTRILVTHALTYLPACDFVVVIADGRVREAGTFRDLVAKQGAFADFVQQYITDAPDEEIDELQSPEFRELERLESAKGALKTRLLSRRTSSSGSGKMSPELMDAVLQKLTSVGSDKLDKPDQTAAANSGRLVDEELMEIGQVSWGVYLSYIKAAGVGLLLYALFVVIASVFGMLGNIWLQEWSDNAQSVRENRTVEPIPTSTGLLYLGLSGLGQMTFTLMLGVAFAMFQVKAAKLIHERLLGAILRAPMSFFDTTPTGRIVNRCGKDVNVIDNDVPGQLDQYCHFIFTLIYSIVGLFIYVPIFGGILLPAGIAYFLIQRLYINAARRVRRLEAVTSSPIYSHFQETLQGIASIRAYGQMERFSASSDHLADIKFSTQMARSLFNRSVSVFCNIISDFIVQATAFAVVYMVIEGKMTAGVAGLSLSSFALAFPGMLTWGVHVASMLEMELVSMERIVEYSNVEPEAPWTFGQPTCPPSWPSEGRVLFRRYGTRYRNGLPLVLHELTADVHPKEKIGIVGRTGAGKSSLTLALFRLIEPAEGSIIIDDIDISRMGLHELRRKLTIIPQDPVLFSGPLRMNLDPFDQYGDDDLWMALERSHLKDFISTLPNGFQHQIDEGGSNLSVGQRQLICLARALLRKSKILVLDEATAAIDVETDSLIQVTIREQFKDCTILTIAHRLNTILDSDRIMVLDSGSLVECDSPASLANQENSIFGSMIKEANLTVPS